MVSSCTGSLPLPNSLQLHEQTQGLCDWALRRFDRILLSHARFHLFFVLLGMSEVALLVGAALLWIPNTSLPLLLAAIFLTAFAYFVLRLYLQSKKPEQLYALCDQYGNRIGSLIDYREGIPEHHLSLANAMSRLAMQLAGREYTYCGVASWLGSLRPPLEKLSAWMHWREVHGMRELLLLTTIEEHLKLVRCEPTDLEVHAALANAYATLSSLYSDPRSGEGFAEERWVPPGRSSEEMAERFRATAEKAKEEFQILSQFAPNDPWVHAQLAYSYHDLGMAEEEIYEYETILSLCPDDRDTLFRLGVCYFRNGRNAAGLRVYEELRRAHYKQAEELMRYYGAQHAISTEPML